MQLTHIHAALKGQFVWRFLRRSKYSCAGNNNRLVVMGNVYTDKLAILGIFIKLRFNAFCYALL